MKVAALTARATHSLSYQQLSVKQSDALCPPAVRSQPQQPPLPRMVENFQLRVAFWAQGGLVCSLLFCCIGLLWVLSSVIQKTSTVICSFAVAHAMALKPEHCEAAL